MNTKDIFLDVVKHITGVKPPKDSAIEFIRVAGTAESTTFKTMDTGRTIVLNGELNTPCEALVGDFGMGKLPLLSSLTKLSIYNTPDAEITVLHDEDTPTSLRFSDDSDVNTDTYRLMHQNIVDQAMKIGTMREVDWPVIIAPSLEDVNVLNEAASIYSGIEPTFSVKTVENKLVFEMGDEISGMAGKRIMAELTDDEKLEQVWKYNLNTVLSILKLGMDGMCIMKFSNQSVCQIEIDSGITKWVYILPAHN